MASLTDTFLTSKKPEQRIASRKIFLFLHFNSHFLPFCFSVLNEARPLSHHPQLKRNGCAILCLSTTIFREANEGDVSVVATSGSCARWFLRRHVWQQD